MKGKPPPRIYCIPAVEAPVVAVFRRGPSDWSHVGRWDLAHKRYEPGAWLHGRIFPRRCDLSPDGRFLCYFAHKPKAAWEQGETYVALSKLPWLHALHAFGTCGTWTRGYYFIQGDRSDPLETSKLPIPYALRAIPVVQFANERRRGWEEAPDSPPRHPKDIWDEHRNARLQKRQPDGDLILHLESIGLPGGEFDQAQAVEGLQVVYALESDRDLKVLDTLQWADWDRQGNLLVATRSGKLQVRNLTRKIYQIEFEVDLSVLEPDPTPAPRWAQHW